MSEQILITEKLGDIIRTTKEYQSDEFIDRIKSAIAYYRDCYFEGLSHSKIDAAKSFMEAVDTAINDMPERFRSLIACRRGCNHCCRMNVVITEDEALLLSEYCKEHNITIDRSYLEAQLKWKPEDMFMAPEAACVFLKDGECSVYEVRPLVCRKWMVSSDPDFCNMRRYPKSPVRIQVCVDAEVICSGVINAKVVQDRMPQMLLAYSK